MLNIQDSHTVTYTLKKLVKLGLVDSEKRGKEIFYGISDDGRIKCEEYRKIRELCLVSSFKSLDHGGRDLLELAEFLRGLSGVYDQASRAAASL